MRLGRAGVNEAGGATVNAPIRGRALAARRLDNASDPRERSSVSIEIVVLGA